MADISAYTFTGHLGADAQVKTLTSGKSVMEMSVAINTGYGDYKKTLWAKVKVWGDRVKNIVDIFKKGALVGGTGEPELSTWTGKDMVEHTDLVITCLNVQLLTSPKKTEEQPEPQEADYPEEVEF